MKITQEIIDRILEVMNGKGLNRSQFSRALGFERNRLSDIIGKFKKNPKTELSNVFINALELKYHINRQWLETGFGERDLRVKEKANDPEAVLLENFAHIAPRFQKRIIEDVKMYRKITDEERGILRVAEKRPSYGEGKKKPKGE